MSKKKRPDVMDDPKVAALVHETNRDIAERLYNQASHDAGAWRDVAYELARENANLRQQLAITAVAEAYKNHRDAKENPFRERGESS